MTINDSDDYDQSNWKQVLLTYIVNNNNNHTLARQLVPECFKDDNESQRKSTET